MFLLVPVLIVNLGSICLMVNILIASHLIALHLASDAIAVWSSKNNWIRSSLPSEIILILANVYFLFFSFLTCFSSNCYASFNFSLKFFDFSNVLLLFVIWCKKRITSLISRQLTSLPDLYFYLKSLRSVLSFLCSFF